VKTFRNGGETDIEVTPIGLGGNKFGETTGLFSRVMLPGLSQEEMDEIIKTALDGGINWFDTAEMYGFGASEQGIARALSATGMKDDEVIIATKWSPFFRRAKNIPRSINKRLQHLNGYTIDLYMVHFPYGFSSPEAEMDAMADLVEAGVIRSVGVSNYNAEQMRRAHAALEKRGLPLAVNQVQYSLLNREIELNGVLDTAKELGVTIIAWGPLGSGALTGKYHKDPEVFKRRPLARRMMLRGNIERSRPLIETLEEVAGKYEASASQVALNWLIHFQGETVVAIPGASKVRHAEQSAAAMKFRLSDEDMARLDELTRPIGM
jgi:aryl-alcohol dehydrogenase-like predicted oxidoreductase